MQPTSQMRTWAHPRSGQEAPPWARAVDLPPHGQERQDPHSHPEQHTDSDKECEWRRFGFTCQHWQRMGIECKHAIDSMKYIRKQTRTTRMSLANMRISKVIFSDTNIGISWNCTDKSGRRNQQYRGETNWTDAHTVLMQSSETTSRRQICYLNLRDIQWNKCMSNHTRFKWILSKTLGASATSTEKKKCYVLFPPAESWVPKEWSSTRCGTEVAKHSRNSENMMPLTVRFQTWRWMEMDANGTSHLPMNGHMLIRHFENKHGWFLCQVFRDLVESNINGRQRNTLGFSWDKTCLFADFLVNKARKEFIGPISAKHE